MIIRDAGTFVPVTYTITLSLRSIRNSDISVKELLHILNDVFTQLNTIWSTAAVDRKAPFNC